MMPAFPFPDTAEAVRQSGIFAHSTWIMLAQSGQYIRTTTGAYVRGLQAADSLQYPVDNDLLTTLVVNVAPHARVVEDGHAGYHLPSVINWATARGAKQNKKGRWYMSIPFRHRAPAGRGSGATAASQQAMMPQQVYDRAKRLRPGERLTAGPTRGRARQAPGLTPYQPRYAPNVRPGYTHASIYEGMQKRGAKGHTQYMSFRTMTENSPGWNVPPRPGTHLSQVVVQRILNPITQLIQEAAARDVQRYLQQQLGGL
jgi:hypothetical protein